METRPLHSVQPLLPLLQVHLCLVGLWLLRLLLRPVHRQHLLLLLSVALAHQLLLLQHLLQRSADSALLLLQSLVLRRAVLVLQRAMAMSQAHYLLLARRRPSCRRCTGLLF